jgi:hypothetical protein
MIVKLKAQLETMDAALTASKLAERSQLNINNASIAGDVLMSSAQVAEVDKFVLEASLNPRITPLLKELFAQDPILEAVWIENLHAVVVRGRSDAQKEKHKRVRDGSTKHNASKGFRFSQIFLHMLMQVFGKSPACARTLSKYRLLATFSATSLSSFRYDRVMEPGITNKAYFQMERLAELYKIHMSTWKGRRRGEWRGVFCFDEIYIKQNVIYNCRSHVALGFVHNSSALYDHPDLFAGGIRAEAKVTHIMASMWRCSATKFDVLGPVVVSSGTINHDTVRTYILNSMKLFNQAGFKTTLLTADGASSNLKAYCDLCGTGITTTKTNPTFWNPYLGEMIPVTHDVPHMLKNMRYYFYLFLFPLSTSSPARF